MYNQSVRLATFLNKSRVIHGDKYDYGNVNYINSYTPVEIVCKKHGSFDQQPKSHASGSGCKKCSLENRTTSKDKFMSSVAKLFGNQYEYNNLPNYIRFTDCIDITCIKHGDFTQRVNQHLNGHGCKKCGEDKRRLSKQQFIERAIKTHGSRYDYSDVIYNNIHTKVIVNCPDHGSFKVSPALHIQRTGCPKCSTSYGHKTIRHWLTKNHIAFEEEYRFDDCRSTNPLPFDFYITELNLLIEFDGIQHFRPIPHFGGNGYFNIIQEHDNIKTKYARDNSYELIRIPYTNLKNIESLLESVL